MVALFLQSFSNEQQPQLRGIDPGLSKPPIVRIKRSMKADGEENGLEISSASSARDTLNKIDALNIYTFWVKKQYVSKVFCSPTAGRAAVRHC
jgi:hypothetical protein